MLLGDGHLRTQQQRSVTANSRFIYGQSSLRKHHYSYFNYIFDLFKPYLSKDFIVKEKFFIDKRTNIKYSSVNFATLSLPCFNYYSPSAPGLGPEGNMFYNFENKKIVPANINTLLTPRGLAFWIKKIFKYFYFICLLTFIIKYNDEFVYADSALFLYQTIIPVVIYKDALSNKNTAIKNNEGKSGIYCWTNLSSNKSYVGSSVNLGRRIRQYFNPAYISQISRKSMVIHKALLKHGYSNFKLEIIEYCTPSAKRELVKKEQHYIKVLNPEYNVLKIAYSSLGYKHTKNTLVKIQKHLAVLNKNKSIPIEVINLETNVSQNYVSLNEAAKNLNTTKNTLKRYILNSKLFKGVYKLNANLTISNFDSNYINHPKSIKIEVTDLEKNTLTSYSSILSASRALGVRSTTIYLFIKRNQTKPYKGRFIFKTIKNGGL